MDVVGLYQNQWAKHGKSAKRFARALMDLIPPLKYVTWFFGGFQGPAPGAVKRRMLRRFGLVNSTWIESGTFQGETTEFLANLGSKVYSMEPDQSLFTSSSARLAHLQNVRILKGTSEEVLPELLPTLSGPLSFWLDGHYSGDGTFLGKSISPIVAELDAISKVRKPGSELVVLVDDVRLFRDDSSGYPSLDFLIEWAEGEALRWKVKNDIFIASSLFME